MVEKNSADVVADILGDWGWADQEVNIDEVQDECIYIIGLDPGGTTGFAIIRIDPSKKKALPELIFLDQIPEGRYGFKTYFRDLYLDERTVLVSEQWDEHNKKGVDREPQYIEGVMHMLWDDAFINYQSPTMKALIPDEWLVEQGVWTPGKRHQMDALIHALVWLRNQAGGGSGGQGQGDGQGEPGEGSGDPIQDAAQALIESLGGESDEKMENSGQEGDGTNDGDGAEHGMSSFGDGKVHEHHEGGTGPGGETESDHDGHSVVAQVQVKGARKERSLNDGFIGFESAEMKEGGQGKTLLDD